MADYLEKLKEEYPGMFGPVGAAPAIASHEFAPIRTAGLWSDYVRPALEWVGETVPGIGRSETSDPSWRAPVHDRLKEEREAAEEYRRRSEEDMRRLEEETREYDKDFKKIGFITGEDPSAAYDVSTEAWKEAVREDPSGVAVMPSPLDSDYTKFIDGRTLPFLDMPVLRPDEMTDDEIDDLISEGLDLSADDPLLSGYTPGIGPDALPETVTAMIDADMEARIHPEFASLSAVSLPTGTGLTSGFFPSRDELGSRALDASRGLAAAGLAPSDTSKFGGVPMGGTHGASTLGYGLDTGFSSPEAAVADVMSHMAGVGMYGKALMDAREAIGVGTSARDSMDFSTHKAAEEVMSWADETGVDPGVAAAMATSKAIADRMVDPSAPVSSVFSPEVLSHSFKEEFDYDIEDVPTVSLSFTKGLSPEEEKDRYMAAPVAPLPALPSEPDPTPVSAPVYSPPETSVVPSAAPVAATVSVPASLVAEVLAPTPHLDSRTVGGMSGRERAEYEALIDAFEHGRLGGGSSGWSGGDDAGMGEWGGSDTGGGGGFGYGI